MASTLFLGPPDSPLLAWLRKRENVVQTAERIRPADTRGADWIVSYGYRHKIGRDALDAVQGRAVNLHISYLPWNRGADPNFWSWIDDTPKGVTIHYVDEGYDTGDIIVQRRMEFDEGETLASSYAKLQDDIQALFRATWPVIKTGTMLRTPQDRNSGTVHRSRDKEPLLPLLTQGWDTPVAALSDFVAERKASAQFWSEADAEIRTSSPSSPA